MPPLKKVLPSVEPRVRRKGATRKNHSILSPRFFRDNAHDAWKHAQKDVLLPLFKVLTPIFLAYAVHYVKVLLKVTVP